MRRLFCSPALTLALWAVAGPAGAARPVEADPNADYPVTAGAGPWMILASTFTGPYAGQLAKQLAYQIRSRDHLNAYVFDFADPERLKMKEEMERQQRGADPDVVRPEHVRTIRVEHQFAVLVGGYKDENAAHAALAAFKKLPPPDLKAPEGVMPFPTVTQGESLDDNRAQAKVAMVNPFAIAFVVPNPAAPPPNKVVAAKDDPFLITLNEGEEHSLLKNPRPYTLAVKEYLCNTFVQQRQAESSSFLKLLGLGGPKPGESLGTAAYNADELAKLLSKNGFDAYVLHTRTSSVVTIGGFDGDKDPAVERVRGRLQWYQQQVASALKSTGQKDPLGLFPEPVLIPVPHPKPN